MIDYTTMTTTMIHRQITPHIHHFAKNLLALGFCAKDALAMAFAIRYNKRIAATPFRPHLP